MKDVDRYRRRKRLDAIDYMTIAIVIILMLATLMFGVLIGKGVFGDEESEEKIDGMAAAETKTEEQVLICTEKLTADQREEESDQAAAETKTEDAAAESETAEAAVEARPESSAANPYRLTESEIAEIARITQLEDGHCGDWCCAYLTASVIINRYLDWGYSSIEEVIYADGQYATAYMTCDHISDMTWKAVRDAVANPDRKPHFQALFIQGDIYTQTECGTYYCY